MRRQMSDVSPQHAGEPILSVCYHKIGPTNLNQAYCRRMIRA